MQILALLCLECERLINSQNIFHTATVLHENEGLSTIMGQVREFVWHKTGSKVVVDRSLTGSVY